MSTLPNTRRGESHVDPRLLLAPLSAYTREPAALWRRHPYARVTAIDQTPPLSKRDSGTQKTGARRRRDSVTTMNDNPYQEEAPSAVL